MYACLCDQPYTYSGFASDSGTAVPKGTITSTLDVRLITADV
jgi:hypothetical protein